VSKQKDWGSRVLGALRMRSEGSPKTPKPPVNSGWLQASILSTIVYLLRCLPAGTASTAAGRFAAAIGPLLPVSRVAHANLRAAMPELDAPARCRTVRGMWDSLGRTAGEFAHLSNLQRDTPSGPGWEIHGEDILRGLAEKGGPMIFFSGHIGNWEILPRAAALYGLPCANFYRAAANPAVDALIRRLREQNVGEATAYFPKGSKGARQALRHLGGGGHLAMLVDQKMNDGIEARLFGLPAMTAPALASLALHFRCPVIPALVQRIGPARLRVVIETPLALPDTGDRAGDILSLTQAANDVLERWIRASPESWLWVHRRFPKTVVPS
jgi:KDO2-lipid IV(A) lauroyltransferase